MLGSPPSSDRRPFRLGVALGALLTLASGPAALSIARERVTKKVVVIFGVIGPGRIAVVWKSPARRAVQM